jgi:hypothetical protein
MARFEDFRILGFEDLKFQDWGILGSIAGNGRVNSPIDLQILKSQIPNPQILKS